MSNDLAFLMAGFDRIEAHVLDSNGIIAGTTGVVATGAAGSPGFRMYAVKDAPNVGAPKPDVVAATGDDAYQGAFAFASQQPRQTSVKFAIEDLSVNQYMGSGNALAIGNSEVGFLDVFPFAPANLAIIGISQAKVGTGSNKGFGIWSGAIFPQVQGIPLGRQNMQERAVGDNLIHLVFSQAAQYPWGETFVPAVHGVQNSVQMAWTSNNRKAMHRFNGDGSTVTFGPLLYQPATTSLNDVVVYKNRYRMTSGVTINQAAQTITFSLAPALNDIICAYYDHL